MQCHMLVDGLQGSVPLKFAALVGRMLQVVTQILDVMILDSCDESEAVIYVKDPYIDSDSSTPSASSRVPSWISIT